MKESIKKRIEVVRRGEVPDGYAETAAGCIPYDWGNAPLSEISSVLHEQAGDQDFETLSISAGIGFVNQAEKFGKELSGKQYAKYTVLRRGDFAYNKGNSKRYPQGCTYMLRERDEAAVPNVFECFRITQGHPEYYEQLFINGFMNKQLTRKINHGVRDDGLLNLTDDDFYSTIFPVPPLAEQQKIAEILAACDRVIELKQQLLEEKRRQKQWLMQMLLDPNSGVRQSACSNVKWITYGISDLGTVITGSTPDKSCDKFWGGDFPWITSQDFNGKYISTAEAHVTEAGKKKCRVLPAGAVLVTCIASIGLNAIAQVDCVTNQQINAVICNGICSEEMLYYIVEYKRGTLERLAGKTAVPIISKAQFEKIKVTIPEARFEQDKITKVLSAADREIQLLQSELEMCQQKKKALMQLLLTGLVRVNA